MKNEQNVPQVRFKVFTDAWEQRELGEVTEDFVEKSTVENQYPVLTSSQQKGIVLQDDYFAGDRVSQSGNLGYFIIPRGYFAYRSRSDNDVFVFNRNDCVDMGIISYFYPVFKPKNVDSDFLLRRLNNGLETQLRISSEGTGQHVLSLKKFKNMTTLFPTISEQQKIGAYFKSLDNLITLHQRKCETLQKLKKSMLQKMFPKNGSLYPEIRFAGFTDAWEQRKLGEIADIIGGGTPSTSNSDYWDGEIDWYAPAEIADQIYVNSSTRKITKKGFENSSAKMLPVGTVLFTSRAGIGKTAILRKEGCTNQGFQSIVPHKNELDSYFIFSRTEELKKYGETKGAGSTFVEVSGKQMANMDLMMPTTFEEQQQIGKYFRNLDKVITLHQRKLETLKKMKKSMLQKMFI